MNNPCVVNHNSFRVFVEIRQQYRDTRPNNLTSVEPTVVAKKKITEMLSPLSLVLGATIMGFSPAVSTGLFLPNLFLSFLVVLPFMINFFCT